jgi:predicted nucleotidyltransferase
LPVDLPVGTSLPTIVGLQQELAAAPGVAVDPCAERKLEPALEKRILAQTRLL